MPIYKYRSFEEAEKALWNFNPDKTYFEKVAFILKSGCELLQPKCKPGVRKFKSIQEANRSRELDILEHAKEISNSRWI